MTYKLNLTEVEQVLGFAKGELSPAGCAGHPGLRFLQGICMLIELIIISIPL